MLDYCDSIKPTIESDPSGSRECFAVRATAETSFRSQWGSNVIGYAGLGIIPLLGLLIVLLAIDWVIRGFSRQTNAG
jgi:hypothetical protein